MNGNTRTTSLGLEFEQTEPQKRLLSWNIAVQEQGKHSYSGTADKAKVAKRRAKNRVAAKSRKKNRG